MTYILFLFCAWCVATYLATASGVPLLLAMAIGVAGTFVFHWILVFITVTLIVIDNILNALLRMVFAPFRWFYASLENNWKRQEERRKEAKRVSELRGMFEDN